MAVQAEEASLATAEIQSWPLAHMNIHLGALLSQLASSRARTVPAWVHAAIVTALLAAAVAAISTGPSYQECLWRGQNDFLQLYSGAALVGTGDLYSIQRVKAYRSTGPASGGVASIYSRPPFYAALLRPLASLPYLGAYWVFQSIILICCGFFAYFFPVKASPGYLAWFPLFFPVLVASMNGQDIMIAVLFCALSLVLAGRGRDLAAGVCLSFCLIKFHLFLFLPVAILAHRRWRILLGGLAGSAAWLGLSFVAGGRGWVVEYLNLLRNPELHPRPEIMPGVFGVLLSFGASVTVAAVVVAGAGMLFVMVLFKIKDFEVSVGLALVAGIFLALHAYVQDCALLILALPLIPCQRLLGRYTRALLLTPIPYLATLSGKPWNLALPFALALFSTAAIHDSRLSRAGPQSAEGAT